HEIIKLHSLAAGKVVKENGQENDLLQRLAEDAAIPFTLPELHDMISDFQQFTGRARQQTEEFLQDIVLPRLEPYKEVIGKIDAELSV
ncbi:MAG: adenylosuccinate lyase, partial [Desulfobulbales bacterium]|nr:adenylosuccinate lyase [Desulfobulbales bacterium]